MKPSIFREYDIRGVVGEDLDSETVYRVARGFSAYSWARGVRSVSLGRDVRLSSDEFRDSMAAGLVDSGLHVIDVGIVPTPLLYFSIQELGLDGGVMITGSHNPPEYNGFKLCVGQSAIYGEMIQELRPIIEKSAFVTGKGDLSEKDIIGPYIKRIGEIISIEGNVTAVVDCGNGTAGAVAPSLFGELGIQVIPLFEEADGTFPNHFPDPTVPENLEPLIAKVKETGADVGVAYDGDSDRIGVVDEKGAVIFGDYLLILFARELLRRKPGATVISEVKASQNLFDDIRKRGGNPIMYRTGHSLIKKKMKEVDAELAGEMSGHIFFKDRYFGYDDAIYASLRLFEIIGKEDLPLSSLLSDLPVLVSTPEIRLECPDEIKFKVVEDVKVSLEKVADEVVDIDGARALFDGGWGLVRASNTQPVLVLRFEGRDGKTLKGIRGRVEKCVRESMAKFLQGE